MDFQFVVPVRAQNIPNMLGAFILNPINYIKSTALLQIGNIFQKHLSDQERKLWNLWHIVGSKF